MNRFLRLLFFMLIVRPLVLIGLGLNVRRRHLLPAAGPAMVVANHNSHLDTLVLMSLFPLKVLPRIHAVAARDYFMKNRLFAWFTQNIIGIIPVERHITAFHEDPLARVAEAIERKEIVIIFPEGSRGEPEQLGEFKNGVAHIAQRYPFLPFSIVYLHGLGKALPRGETSVVPFFCDVFIGEPMVWSGDRHAFMSELTSRMTALAEEGHFAEWK